MPHKATLLAFDNPDIFLQSFDLQYGHVIIGVVGWITFAGDVLTPLLFIVFAILIPFFGLYGCSPSKINSLPQVFHTVEYSSLV